MTARPSPGTPRAPTVACASAGALVVLAVLVHLGVTQPVDEAVRGWARPDDVWGPLQVRADLIVEGLRPTSTLLLLAAIATAISLARRSPRPLVVAAATGLLMLAATVSVKLLLHRPDPHGAFSDQGGSFPSGHTVTIIVCSGLVTMLLRPGARWGRWLVPLVLGTLMAAALLLEAAHWVSDLLGGALLGVTILAAVAALDADRWSAAGRGRDHPRSLEFTRR
jgi:membrane-associated phospholipid phosphatase